MQTIYFFKNLASSATEVISELNNTNGTVDVFKLTPNFLEGLSSFNHPYQQYSIGLVVSGALQTAEVNLEIFDGTNWLNIANYVAADVSYTKTTSPTPIVQILNGIFWNTQHRIRIVNPNGNSLTNINVYFVMY